MTATVKAVATTTRVRNPQDRYKGMSASIVRKLLKTASPADRAVIAQHVNERISAYKAKAKSPTQIARWERLAAHISGTPVTAPATRSAKPKAKAAKVATNPQSAIDALVAAFGGDRTAALLALANAGVK